MAIASLILGISSIVFGLFCNWLDFIFMITSIVGIILGSMAKKKDPTSGAASAGLVCSIIGLIISSIIFVACACMCICAGGGSALYY